jgi:DNA-binding GntR family transcriptional regulator
MARKVLPSGTVSRGTSGEQAAFYIRRLIFDGALRPGARVHQHDIAQSLGMSRIPVREALVALERQGWVTTEPNRGAFVAQLDERAVQDHYELFGLVYGFAATKAIERSEAVLGEKLTQLATDFAAAADPREAQRIAIAFHAAVVDASSSTRVHVLVGTLSALVPGDFYELVPGARSPQQRGFAAIARAIRRRDCDRAAAEYARMMRAVGRTVVQLFHQRGLLQPSSD